MDNARERNIVVAVAVVVVVLALASAGSRRKGAESGAPSQGAGVSREGDSGMASSAKKAGWKDGTACLARATPEEIAKLPSIDASGEVLTRVADYFACRALGKDSVAVCGGAGPGKIGAGGTEKGGEAARTATDQCKQRYHEGLLVKAFVADDRAAATSHCVAMFQIIEPGKSGGEFADLCGTLGGADKTDVTGSCRDLTAKKIYPDTATCETDLVFLKGTPSLCSKVADPTNRVSCEHKALFVRALKGERRAAAATIYAPLLDKADGACDPVRKSLVGAYCGAQRF